MIISINRQRLSQGKPPIGVRKTRSSKATYYESFAWTSPSRLVWSPDKPLPCGAKVWIEIP